LGPSAPRPVKGRAGCWVRKGVAPPAVISPGKNFENSDAKSCILVTTCCEISCFLKTTAEKLGDQYIVGPQAGPPTFRLGDQLPRFLRLLRLCKQGSILITKAISKKQTKYIARIFDPTRPAIIYKNLDPTRLDP